MKEYQVIVIGDCPKGLASRPSQTRRKSGGYNLEQCQGKVKRLLLNRWV
ncbi:MAG TPA: hypothetical protein V6C71_07160 [Coleofasciculaceae cyanobacterium]